MKNFSFLRKFKVTVKTEIIVVAAILATFVMVAMATIGVSSIWFDEAFGAYMLNFSFADIFRFTALDVHPPLYYWLLKVWSMVFGTGDVALRSMSVFFAVAALIVGYLLLRKIFGSKTALVSLPFVALSPILIRYAQEARMYTFIVFVGLAATYVLYVLRQRPSKKLWVLYGLLVAIGMWTHYFSALIWLGHWVWRAIDTHQRSLKRWAQKFFTKEWLLTHALAVGIFAPWLPWMLRQFMDVQSNGFWIPPISPMTLPSYASDVLLYLPAALTSPWLTVLLWATVGLAVVLVYRTLRSLRGHELTGYLLLVVGALAPVALLVAVSLPPLQSTFIDRYILTAAVLFTAVIAVAVAKAPAGLSHLRAATAVLLIVCSIAGISNVYWYGNYNQSTGEKHEAKQVVAAIRDTAGTAGEPIIANTPWLYYEAAQYSNDKNTVYFIDKYTEYKFGSLEMLRQSDIGKIKDLDGFLDEHQKVWYIGRPGDAQIDPPAGNVEVLRRIYVNDSVTGQPAYQAVEYQVSAE